MRKTLQAMLFALVAIMMPIGAWAQEPISVTIPETGYTTLYYGDRNLNVPEGAKAYILTNSESIIMELITEEVIYSGTAVIIQGNPGTYIFNVHTESSLPPRQDNILKGSDEETVFNNADVYYYALTTDEGVACWKKVEVPYTNPAHSAVLELPKEHDYASFDYLNINGSPIIITEATWGASAEDLDNEGTLAQAITMAAAENSDVAYIQMQSNVTTTDGLVITSGTFTLDLNGYTLTSDGYTLDIANEGTNVTLVDNSEGGAGKVVCNSTAHAAVLLTAKASITIEGGSYESAHQAVSVLSGCSATITGGTFTGAIDYTIKNSEGTLSIEGGSFGGTNIYNLIYTNSATTITGGTFAGGSDGTIAYDYGKLDLTGYPTTAAEGTTPLADISVYNYANVLVSDKTIALPEDYGLYNGEEIVTALEAYTKYTIGEIPFEAKWGTSAEALTNKGTFAQAIAAVTDYDSENGVYNASDIRYIRLNGNVNTDNNNTIYGGNFTLDLNGYTLSSDASNALYINSGAKVTIDDSSAGKTGLVRSESSDVVSIQTDAQVTIVNGTFETAAVGIRILCSFGELTIKDGVFTAGVDGFCVFSDGALTIEGGTFNAPSEGEFLCAISVGSESTSTTVKGGLFTTAGLYGVFYKYAGGAIDFSEYPTTAPEGTTPLTAINVYIASMSEAEDPAFSPIILLESYSFLNSYSQPVLTFEAGQFYSFAHHQHAYDETTGYCTCGLVNPNVTSITIADGERTSFFVDTDIDGVDVTYTRTLPNMAWNALYVPFEIPVSELTENYDVAYINDVHSYDTDDNGTIDDLKMEIIKITGGTLHANHPYLIRAKSEAGKTMSLSFSDITLHSTHYSYCHQINCSSAYMTFEVEGTYAPMTQEDYPDYLVINTEGEWTRMAENTALNPFRIYLYMQATDGTPVIVEEEALSKIRICLPGEEATGIDQVTDENGTAEGAIYDLQGRRVSHPTKGIYIVNGKKVAF